MGEAARAVEVREVVGREVVAWAAEATAAVEKVAEAAEAMAAVEKAAEA